jgi:hypothetical protein
MKSKIEVREYAVNKAAEIMGKGTPTDSLITKAKEIEKYVIGEAILPEVGTDTTESLVDGLKSIIGGVNDIAYPHINGVVEADK